MKAIEKPIAIRPKPVNDRHSGIIPDEILSPFKPVAGDDTPVDYSEPVRWYQRKLLWVIAFLVVAGGFAAVHFGKPRYVSWKESRQIARARQYLEKGDHQRAMLEARVLLQSNLGNAEAIRILARALEAARSPMALEWRVRLEGLRPNDPENCIALANDALDAGDAGKAERALGNLGGSESQGAAFHAVSARLATIRGDRVAAENHWQTASNLEPKEDSHQLNLATLRLKSRKPEVRTEALNALTAISQRPPNGLQALRVLLADATEHSLPSRVKELADALVAAQGCAFTDRLTRLAVLRKLGEPEYIAYLAEVRADAVANPAHFCQLLDWMNQNDLALAAAEWVDSLPPEFISKPPACKAVADVYTRISEWPKLRRMVEKGNWGGIDYLRRAYLARALEHLDDPAGGSDEWKGALAAAASGADSPNRLGQLALAAAVWGWEERAEDILWKLAATERCPRAVPAILWTAALDRGDTARLQRIAGLMAKADPRDVIARNNYTFLCLLTRTQEGDPHSAAKVLYARNPRDPSIARTYSLSLYQQRKPKEAVAIMSELEPGDLREPKGPLAFYQAVFLTAVGRGSEAGEFLKISGDRALLPEERALLVRAQEAAGMRVRPARAGELPTGG